MSQLFRFPHAEMRSPSVDTWLRWQKGELGEIARHWFEVIRECGDDVRELLHDGHPTACVADAAFAYVDTFKAHVNIGFFRGAELADPKGLFVGTGKRMRHVKIRPGKALDAAALAKLIDAAYADMRRCVHDEGNRPPGFVPLGAAPPGADAKRYRR
jgi:hypothetical protein